MRCDVKGRLANNDRLLKSDRCQPTRKQSLVHFKNVMEKVLAAILFWAFDYHFFDAVYDSLDAGVLFFVYTLADFLFCDDQSGVVFAGVVFKTGGERSASPVKIPKGKFF